MAPFVVNTLTISGSVNFNNNDIYVRVSGATVNGSVKATNNKSLAYGNPADVSGNVIKGSLSCSGNVCGPDRWSGHQHRLGFSHRAVRRLLITAGGSEPD